jgi:hypothetical protein
MDIENIDGEFKMLMDVMDREQQMDDLLVAIKMILESEKMAPGLDRRKMVADALGMLTQALPAAWASVCEANPDLSNDHQRQGAIRVALAMLFDTLSGTHHLALAANAHEC